MMQSALSKQKKSQPASHFADNSPASTWHGPRSSVHFRVEIYNSFVNIVHVTEITCLWNIGQLPVEYIGAWEVQPQLSTHGYWCIIDAIFHLWVRLSWNLLCACCIAYDTQFDFSDNKWNLYNKSNSYVRLVSWADHFLHLLWPRSNASERINWNKPKYLKYKHFFLLLFKTREAWKKKKNLFYFVFCRYRY